MSLNRAWNAAWVLWMVGAVGASSCASAPSEGPAQGAAVQDGGAPTDGGSDVADASNGGVDAGSPDAAGGALCDADGDGFVRDEPGCARNGYPLDCDDGDATRAPGAAECRDTQASGCGTHAGLAGLVNVPELGQFRTHVAPVNAGQVDAFSVLAAPNAWGRSSRAVTVAHGFSTALVRVFPPDPAGEPSELAIGSLRGAPVRLARLAGTDTTVVALAREDGTAELTDVSDGLSRPLFVKAAQPQSSVTEVGVLDGAEPGLVTVTSFANEVRLDVVDRLGTRGFAVPHTGTLPWVVTTGQLILMGSWSGPVRAASSHAGVPHAITLVGNLAGRPAAVTVGGRHLVYIPTSAGLETMDFPICSEAEDCSALGTLLPPIGGNLINGYQVSAAPVGRWSDVVAVGLMPNQASEDTRALEVRFFGASAPTLELTRTAVLGAGAFQNAPVAHVLAFGLSNGDDLYGGSFLLVSALVNLGDRLEQWTTGFVVCAVE
jgi:hypothetical protein